MELTNYSAEVGGQILTVRCDRRLEAQAHWLLARIRELRETGVSIRDGETIQVGWTVLSIEADRESAGLAICEPNFTSDPFSRTRRDVTSSLSVLLRQSALLRAVGITPTSQPTFQDKVIADESAFGMSARYMQRSEVGQGDDSGWYIGPLVGSEKDRRLVSLYSYELLRRDPVALDVIALPSGWLIVFEGDAIRSIVDSTNLEMWTRRAQSDFATAVGR